MGKSAQGAAASGRAGLSPRNPAPPPGASRTPGVGRGSRPWPFLGSRLLDGDPAVVVLRARVLDGDAVIAVARRIPDDRADVVALGLGVTDARGRRVPADEVALFVADLEDHRHDRLVVAHDDDAGPLPALEAGALAQDVVLAEG